MKGCDGCGQTETNVESEGQVDDYTGEGNQDGQDGLVAQHGTD